MRKVHINEAAENMNSVPTRWLLATATHLEDGVVLALPCLHVRQRILLGSFKRRKHGLLACPSYPARLKVFLHPCAVWMLAECDEYKYFAILLIVLDGWFVLFLRFLRLFSWARLATSSKYGADQGVGVGILVHTLNRVREETSCWFSAAGW